MIIYNTPDTLKVFSHHITKFQNLPFSWYCTRGISAVISKGGPLLALRASPLPNLAGYLDTYDRYLRRAAPFLVGENIEHRIPTYNSTLDTDAFRFEPGFVVLSPSVVFLPKDKNRVALRRWRLKGEITWIWLNHEVSELLLPYREMIRDKDWISLPSILHAILLQAFDYFYVAYQKAWTTEIKAHPKLDFYAWYEKGRTIPKAGLEEIKRGGDVYEVLGCCRDCFSPKSNCNCEEKKVKKVSNITFQYPDILIR